MTLLLVAVGAAIGAPLRYLTDGFLQRRTGGRFPWGTLAVNLLGCLLLGILTATTDRTVTLLVGVGFCGAFTTYSTFGWETIRLAESARLRSAAGNVVLSLGGGLLAAVLGAWLGASLGGTT